MSTGSVAVASSAKKDEFNPFLSMAKGFDQAAELLGLDEGMREVLRQPDRELKVSLPMRSRWILNLPLSTRNMATHKRRLRGTVAR